MIGSKRWQKKKTVWPFTSAWPEKRHCDSLHLTFFVFECGPASLQRSSVCQSRCSGDVMWISLSQLSTGGAPKHFGGQSCSHPWWKSSLRWTDGALRRLGSSEFWLSRRRDPGAENCFTLQNQPLLIWEVFFFFFISFQRATNCPTVTSLFSAVGITVSSSF